MKLVAFLGLIGLSLIGSLIFGRKDLNKHKKILTTIVKAILLNVIILGLGIFGGIKRKRMVSVRE